MIQGTLHWVPRERGGRLFVGETASGNSVLFDEPGSGVAASPMETVALALASCTGFDVVQILLKKRQRLTHYEVGVQAEQAVGPPAVFTSMRVHHRVRGHGVLPEAVQQAIDLSHEKYCSVGVMLEKTAAIRHTFEVIEERPDAFLRVDREGAAAA
jgi:putative redox protein